MQNSGQSYTKAIKELDKELSSIIEKKVFELLTICNYFERFG
jgi:hypothetical protein